ncbi:cell filamentation protein Fic [Lacticaseibacillus chiayiensis]|uniref:Cell filamentation protein Fic n=1 Tax=Lacticaseibacillus chiayiensis TaxID=2100821 RepID=A0A4Q1TQ81_9LACO|nr:Fic family protein [Lacticaseibacillus chiayiensis]QVI34364.1 Fic family protein [Lacticaseibacillus chiayiensis]RXT20806.1 cell filamentation protein Fic [Lacticaseibacillus chiayiensis]UYN56100.1 Fic family protein [Lacticaseibacillus chiayiensis]
MRIEEILHELTKLHDEMQQYRPLDATQAKMLHQQIKVDHVWSSNAIEGNSLSQAETESILDAGLTIHGAPVKDILETLDLSEAYDFVEKLAIGNAPISERDIRDINRIVTLQTVRQRSEAGQFRTLLVWPSGAKDRPYLEPFDIKPAMEALVEWMTTAEKDLHPVVYAAQLHAKFVAIHPFLDGNGRTARLLMNMALTRHGYPVINIQPDPAARTAYMEALEISRSKHDLEPFERLVATYVKKALQDHIAILKLHEQNVADAKTAADQSPLQDFFKRLKEDE